jgi:uncharacterized protein YegL
LKERLGTELIPASGRPRVGQEASVAAKLPGGKIAKRDIHFFWIVDGSESMQGEKIQSLNFAIANAIPEMRKIKDRHPHTRVFVRALRFASDVQWVVGNGEPVPLSEFEWHDIKASGKTKMGGALAEVAHKLNELEQKRGHYLAPALILVTDGQPTDDFADGLRRLMEQKFGREATRLAVAIGADADLDALEKFVGDPRAILHAHNSEQLAAMIPIVSTSALEHSSIADRDKPVAAPKVAIAGPVVW